MSRINGFISAVNDWFTGGDQTTKFKSQLPALIEHNSIWLNNLVENGEPQKTPTDGSQDFWVAKSTDAQTLRNRLLKEHFDFEGDDVAAYEKRIGQTFKIYDTGKCSTATAQKSSCDWATAKDINNWRVQNGKVSINLPQTTVNDLRQFKRERILDKALLGISDPALGQTVKNDLLQISNPNATNRTDAANRLLNLENAKPEDAQKIREAVRQIAARSENGNNAFTNLVLAKVQLEETANKPALMHPASDVQINHYNEELRKNISDAEWQIVKAAKLASGVDVLTGKIDVSKINRAEAAWVNNQAAAILRQTGNEAEAEYREIVGRFWEASEAERKSTEGVLGLTIRRVKAGSMPFVTVEKEAVRNLREYQTERDLNYKKPVINFAFKEDPYKREWKIPSVWGTDKIYRFVDKKTEIEMPLERYNMGKGSIRFSGTEKLYEGQILVNKKGEIVPPGKEYTLNVKKNGESAHPRDTFVHKQQIFGPPRNVESRELAPQSVTRSFQASSLGSGLGQLNAGIKFLADYGYGTTQKKIEERMRLEKDLFNANNYPVPPRPEDLPRERENLRRIYGSDRKSEAHINLAIQRMEELSYAFWGK